ncbi:quaternary ammonium compound efflux SMR transporter SugE [Acidisoma silvae]|uniref:Guanidinium exporter n=1 Tax=Acidisoma silvae TaxID=2802396 RepID=A0A963YT07_9PROT|nr:quaternary ammonium compound efflux SMR transporter SugE [Acidisoma silvae]MCB8876544.1 quaternary ammonium compound efflux SMR transporter SugE [Acidisoma silvae]
MNWLFLVVAGCLEIAWAIAMKYSEGFTKLVPSVLTVVLVIASMSLLSLSLKTLPVGLAYGVWTGIGTVGTAILGILLFGEPAGVARLCCMGLIVAGIAGLRILSAG